MNSRLSRRQLRILLVAVIPVVATTIVWMLESGCWLVIYNDTTQPIHEVTLAAGDEQWIARELEARESRRLRVRARGPLGELVVSVQDWPTETAYRAPFAAGEMAVTTLRIDSSRTITATSERGLWGRWLNW